MTLPSETDRLGVRAPLGLLKDERHLAAGQVRGRPARRRRCLLKGCEREFEPRRVQARYCSEACRSAACRWRRWQAAWRWRKTAQGQACRREQSCRHRKRISERRQAEALAADSAIEEPGVGQRPAPVGEKTCCHRPGCYVLYIVSRRSPSQRYCSCSCRQALRRVMQRERRWGRRRKRFRRLRLPRRHKPPSNQSTASPGIAISPQSD